MNTPFTDQFVLNIYLTPKYYLLNEGTSILRSCVRLSELRQYKAGSEHHLLLPDRHWETNQ